MTSKTSSETKKHFQSPRILDDVPSEKDEFDSHKKISETIEKIISTSNGGATIGLEGQWGSGKSTIIKILQENLKERKKTFFFNFDAWVHQDDSLRRAFLEGLISAATDKQWFYCYDDGGELTKKWIAEKENLSRKIKTQTKSARPVISRLGKILFSSLLLFPLGLSLVGGIASRAIEQLNFTQPPLTLVEKAFTTGLLLTTLPFLVVLVNWIYCWLKRVDGKDDLLWAMFYQKGHVSETSRTSESIDTSTIEFQNLFGKLMADLLNSGTAKLVIVLDNLDRISSDEAAETWPVLRSFIDNPEFAQLPWFKQMWIIVPYARDALSVKQVTTAPEIKGNSTVHVDDEGGEGATGVSVADPYFLDKIFQLKIFVPAPVLSNWRAYLGKLLRQAFVDQCDEEDVHSIYLLMTRYYGVLNPPGPRQIKNIINGIVVTELQWAREIPLAHQAYFALLKRDETIGDLRQLLLNGTVKLHKDLLGDDVQRSLVALECNVPLKLADQTLFAPLIRSLLALGSTNGKLAEHYDDVGFSALFDSLIGEVLAENARGNSILFIQNVALLCADEFFLKNSKASQRNLLREIRNSMSTLEMFPIGSVNVSASLELLARQDDEKIAKVSLIAVFSRTSEFFQDEGKSSLFDEKKSTDYLEKFIAAHELWSNKAIREYAGLAPILLFGFPGNRGKYIEIYKRLKAEGKVHLLEMFELSRHRVELLAILQNSILDRPTTESIEAIEMLSAEGLKIPHQVYQDLLYRVSREASGGGDNIDRLLPYLISGSVSNSEIYETLREFVSAGWAYHYLAIYNPYLSRKNDDIIINLFSVEEKMEFCSSLLYLLARDYPVGDVDLDVASKVEGKELFKTITSKPDEFLELVYVLAKFLVKLNVLEVFLRHLDSSGLTKLSKCIYENVD